MKRILAGIWADIKRGENLDLIVVGILAIVIAVLDLLDFTPPEVVSSLTLATLGVLAFGFLVTRWLIRDTVREADRANAVRFLSQADDSLQRAIRTADEIWMLGLILRGTTFDHFHRFVGKAERGGTIRAMICDPSRVDLDIIEKRFSRGGTAELFASSYDWIVCQYARIRGAAEKGEKIQLKMLDFVPSVSMYVFPNGDEGGVAFVEVYCYKSRAGSIPKFKVSERENPQWYQHFVSQFEAMWDDATPVDLDAVDVDGECRTNVGAGAQDNSP